VKPIPTDQPFAERRIEELVYSRLRSDGYTVQTGVRVPSGIVDAVATRADERLVTEAKGEDRGGYTSAQMNFLIGIGQLASRMVDEETGYALAFPDTPDYRRVVSTFKGSRAFRILQFRFLSPVVMAQWSSLTLRA